MLEKNSMPAGVLVGIVFPLIATGTAWLLRSNTEIMNRPALPCFIAVALNLVLVRISLKKNFDVTAKGIMLATFVCMILMFTFKYRVLR